jgi:hypothetical protein
MISYPTRLVTAKSKSCCSAIFPQLAAPFASTEAACLSKGPQSVRSYDFKGHLAGVLQSAVRNIGPSSDDMISLDLAVKYIGPSRSTISALSIPPELTARLPEVVSSTIVAIPPSREV